MLKSSGSAATARQLLAQLRAREISVYLDQGRLKTRAAPGAIDEDLAARIKANRDELVDVLSTFVVTAGQRRLWLSDRRSGGSALYNMPIVVKMHGALDRPALTRALQMLVQRHQSLRTNCIEQDGEVVARIRPVLALEVHQHSMLDPAAVPQTVDALIARPFDLCNDPLIRADLIQMSTEDHVLVVCIHHIVTDGWSCGVLAKELEALYNAAVANEEAALPRLPIQFSDHADWLAQPEQQQSLAAGLDFWREHLRDVPQVHSLPLDFPRPRVQSHEGGALESVLPEQLTEQVRAFAADQGITVYVLLQAALALLLSRWSNDKDIVIGTSSSGRIRPELEHLVGFFVNPLVLRNRIELGATVHELCAASKRLLLAASEHQQIAFERLVEEVLPARSASHAPIFQIMLDYQGAASSGIALTGLECQLVSMRSLGAKYDIEITATDLPRSLHLRWTYAVRLFNEQTILRLRSSFELLVSELVKSPRRCLSELPFLPAAEVDLIVRNGAGPVVQYPEDPFPKRFAAAARAHPHAVAVECRGEELSYAELNTRVNKLAHHLMRAKGFRPGDRAAIYMEPGPDLIIALLAVLKAGGTYVPIDPAYPQERIEYILKDSGAQVVLDKDWHGAPRADQPDEEPSVDIDGSSLAYILYTSGSTGRPKGVMISHRGLANYLNHAASYFSAELRGAIVSSSICFDATITSLLTPLLIGKRVVVLESHLDAVFKGLKHYLLADGNHWLFKITPAHLSALCSECAGHARCLARHVLVIGGEQLNHSLVETWQANWLPQARYINEYGPTETVVGCSVFSIHGQDSRGAKKGAVAIGKPIANVGMYVIHERQLAPVGVAGELYISGPGVAAGYVNAPELTAQRFVTLPDVARATIFYKSGDLVRLRPDGNFEFIKRCDDQVKIRGYRIELGEIEAALREIAEVHEAAVLIQAQGEQHLLVAYLQPKHRVEDSAALLRRVRGEISKSLLEYMVPAAFELIETLPLTPNGKVDKKALPKVDTVVALARSYAPPQSELQQLLCGLWQTALGREQVGIHDNFMEIGGNSVLILKIRADLESRLGRAVDITAFFEFPTIAELSRHLDAPDASAAAVAGSSASLDGSRQPIAVIALAGRFPGAASPEELWSNVCRGVESLQTFSDAELLANGLSAQVIATPGFVKSAAVLADVERFDADFFKMTPREAQVLDPQQRLLFECSVEALERAGYGNTDEPVRCAVFVGCGESFYLAQHLLPDEELLRNIGLNALYANSANYPATRIAYKLNLSGPAINVATACSTSLVAVHQAINSLRLGECDMALAGGAGISQFGPSGYQYRDGGIESPDGHCRAFDHRARGTRGGNGGGIVLLKRLGDAVRDGDTILAVIKGSAINNDGSQKAGYTAPSVVGQANVIESALRDADVRAEQIQYVETHGTGTPIGDPVEFKALSKVFASSAPQVCALGTLKPNIGHLDAAAGIAGLIKTVQAVQHATLPPCINFERPNEMIAVADSPFYFNTEARQWTVAPGERRRAGVSAFGIGGTNVHVIVEEAPESSAPVAEGESGFQLFPVSARTESALRVSVTELRGHLERHRQQRLADVAFTLQAGRKAHPFRTFVVARHREDLIAALGDASQLAIQHCDETSARPAVVFLFPGQGSQYAGMALGLLGSAQDFTEPFERCRQLIQRFAAFDILDAIGKAVDDDTLLQTGIAQPVLFAVEYSLAVHLLSLGVQPTAMIGHSLGEFVAACIAGVFQLEDAVRLVCARARLMQASDRGAMLTISADRAEAERFYDSHAVALAAINGPRNYVLSGEIARIDEIEARLKQADVACRKLQTSHAFHSPMMQAAATALREEMRVISLHAPRIRFVSNVSGAFITEAEARDPDYWIGHLLSPVQFSQGLESLATDLRRQSRALVLVEVGPGNSLATLARRNPSTAAAVIVPLMRHSREQGEDSMYWLKGLGALWAAGCDVNWRRLDKQRKPRNIQLPTYPFERKRHWVDKAASSVKQSATAPSSRPEDGFYLPVWRLSPASSFQPAEADADSSSWLLLADRAGIAEQLAAHIPADRELMVVRDGQARFEELPRRFAQSTTLSIVCLWAIDPAVQAEDDYESFRHAQRRCFHPLLQLLKTLFEKCPRLQLRLHVITDRVFRVTGDEEIRASLAPLRGLCKVAPQENPQVSCRLIDIDAGGAGAEAGLVGLARQLWREIHGGQNDPEVALRGNGRWVKAYEPLDGSVLCKPRQRLVPRGHYLITGGLGRIGIQLALLLASDYQARITLLSRRGGERCDDLLSRIKAHGADAQFIQADVSRPEQLEQAVARAEQTFGSLNGIIHAAGVVQDSAVPLQQTDEAVCDRQFASKVAGLLNLKKILTTRTVDFCVVTSSLSVELGGLGFTAYAAANSYIDAFVQRMRNAGQDHWACVDWDGWHADHGPKAFAVAMRHVEHPCLINSNSDLKQRFEKWVKLSAQRSRPENEHGSPDVARQFLAPATRTQQVLAQLWRDVLGIERMSIDDNFFLLGGDSLLATRLVAKIRSQFAVADAVFSLADFFANPAIGAIAEKLDGAAVLSALETKRKELRERAGVEQGVF